MSIVDDLDEWLDLASLRHSRLPHVPCDLEWVPFDAGNERMGEGMRLGAGIEGLDDDHLEQVRQETFLQQQLLRKV